MMSIRSLALLAVVGASIALLTPLHAQYLVEQTIEREAGALCEGDSDCMELCRPDDELCDGGPDGEEQST